MSQRRPLLFLHGAFSGPDVWMRFVAPWFAKRGHRIMAPRLAPTAAFPGAVPKARLRDYVRAARDAAEELGRPVVIGHSLGGFVAQHLAGEGRVAGAVLAASPGPLGLAPSFWRLALAAPDVFAAMMVAQAGGAALLGPATARRAFFTEETPDEWVASVAPPPMRESPAALMDGMSWDLPFWPRARATPMLALLGDRDAIVPRTDLWALGAVYGAETEVLSGRGHGLPFDPAWQSLAWRIGAWLDERGLAGAAPRRRSATAG